MNPNLTPPHERQILLRLARNHQLLSPRELTVIEQWAQGRGLRTTAYGLGLSITTVRTYRERAIAKLEAFVNAEEAA